MNNTKKVKHDVSTEWAKATRDIFLAYASLMECLQSGKNAWLELRENGDQAHPIMCDNPALNDIENWKSAYGVPKYSSPTNIRFLNSVEEDLYHNYVWRFGDEAAIKKYKESGIITKDLIRSIGVGFAIKRVDAIKHREVFVGDGYTYQTWINHWIPKVPVKTVDTSHKWVFVVCYDLKDLDIERQIRRANQFLSTAIEKNIKYGV